METVQTVRGPVPVADLGFTLPHEHVLIDLVRIFPANMLAFDFQLVDQEVALEEVGRYVRAASDNGLAPGRPALVDVTTDERMGRDPRALRGIAEALDLHLVMGCGRYREPWFEPDFGRIPTAELGDRLIDEIERGVGDSGIRPGIIGELGADRDFVSPAEERVLRAGARAHRRTGLPITLHARISRVGLSQLDILAEEGVDLRRVVVGHSDTVPDPDFHELVARRGAWVQFDTIRGRFPTVVERRLRFIQEMRRRGRLDRLLLSQDVCAQSHLRAYGNTGYDYLATEFLARLHEAGLAQAELEAIFVANPRTMLTPSS
jgi:predicted metal-dependent phosphotriesterase family hydrolase